MISTVDRKNRELFLNWLIVIHLGTNPVNGGNPPRDKRFIRMIILFGLFLIEFIWDIK